MSLQKNFPRDRKYYFWAIFLSHLIATDARSSETDRKLFGTLAYRMISKAAADVPENVSPGLKLMCIVFLAEHPIDCMQHSASADKPPSSDSII